MARTRTRAQLRTEIMAEGDFRAVRHDPDTVNRRIDQGYAEIYRKLAEACPDLFDSSTNDITVVSGTDSYSLPADFWKITGASILDTDGNYYRIELFNKADRHRLQGGAADRRATRYRVKGSKIYLTPTPNWGGTLRVWYIAAPAVASGDSSTFDGIAGYEDYIVNYAIAKGKRMDKYDDTPYLQEMARIELEIAQMADNDEAETDYVRDDEISFDEEYIF